MTYELTYRTLWETEDQIYEALDTYHSLCQLVLSRAQLYAAYIKEPNPLLNWYIDEETDVELYKAFRLCSDTSEGYAEFEIPIDFLLDDGWLAEAQVELDKSKANLELAKKYKEQKKVIQDIMYAERHLDKLRNQLDTMDKLTELPK